MAASIQFFTDLDCKEELSKSGSIYDLTVGPVTGLDGDKGDRSDIVLYAKNTGDQTGINTIVYKFDDELKTIEIGDQYGNFVDDRLELGDMLPGSVSQVNIKVVIPPGLDPRVESPIIKATFKTLP